MLKRFIFLLIFITYLALPVGLVNAQTPTLTPTQQVFPSTFYKNPIAVVDGVITSSWGDLYSDITGQLLQPTLCNGGDRSLGLVFTGDVATVPYPNNPNPNHPSVWFRYTTELATLSKLPQLLETDYGNAYSIVAITASNYSTVYRFDVEGTTYQTKQLINWLFPANDYPDYDYKWAGTTASAYFGTAANSPTNMNKLEIGWNRSESGTISGTLYAMCYGSHMPTQICNNVLMDGGMEQQPISSFWFPESSGDGRYSFGRMDSNILGDGGALGSAICGEGQQVIGNMDCWPSLSYFQCQSILDRYADIRQRFFWPGGRLYYEYSAKGRAQDNLSRNIAIRVYVKNLLTQDLTLLRDDDVPNGEWVTRSGSTATSLTEGNYNFYVIMRPNAGNTSGDSFIVDDIIASECPLDGQPCSFIEPASTTTATVMVPTGTATPNGFPGENLIDNCGFEQGPTSWIWQRQLVNYTWVENSFVIYNANDNWSHINYAAYNPGIRQAFTWPGGNAYLSFYSDTNYLVYFRNRYTNAVIDAISGEYPFDGFSAHYATVYLPAGSYDLSLHIPAGSAYGQYDDISLSAGNYGTCGGGVNYTPTAPATATSNATSTMWPTWTQQPSRTVGPGTPTSTRIPSFTPYPTYTPPPTQAITRTPTTNPSVTPYPTYTARPTYTPQPTYTPNAQGTIEASQTPTASPPPPELPPPPSYYSDCQRPATGGEIAGWLEYQKCQTLSFFYMSPNAVATYAAIPTAFDGKEPFGTMNEVGETNNQMKGLLDSYDWDNTGLPGTGDTINLDQFLTPTGPLIDGQFDFGSNPGPEYSYECDVAMAELVGPYLAQGVCFILNILRSLGIMPWLQLVVNISAIGFLAIYIWKKWIDAGAGG